MASDSQVKYAESLIQQLGYDVDDYDLQNMTSWEISELIDDLKEELEG